MSLLVPARWFTVTTGRDIALGVVHRMQAPDRPTTAEATAQFFRTLPAGRKASAHRCYDSDSSVRCVLDKDIAYGAPGANHDGLHYELAGNSEDDDWDHPSMVATLDRCAADAAEDAVRYDWPIRWRVASDLLAGGDRRRGLTSHIEITHAYPNLGNHWDPGPHFDPDHFISLVEAAAGAVVPTRSDHFTFLSGGPGMESLAPTTIVGFVSAAECGVTGLGPQAGYEQAADGGVKAVHGAPFYGSYPGLKADNRKGERYAVGITPREDGGPGYTSWFNDSTRGYSFGPDLNGWPTWPQA